MPQSIKSIFNQYLQQKGRVAYRLQLLAKMFGYYKNGASCISNKLKKTHNPIKIFKILVLLHHCCIQAAIQPMEVLPLFSLINPIAKKCTQQQLHKLLCSTTIPQYQLYLQKHYSLQSQQKFHCQSSLPSLKTLTPTKTKQTSQASTSGSISTVSSIKTIDKNTRKFTIDDQLYTRINLIRLGLEFVEILFTFGRYFHSGNQFIVDFNIILAKDISKQYELIRRLLQAKISLFDEDMKLTLEKIHQKMYIVYYNCYYFRYSKSYEPIWIQIEYKKDNKKTNRTVQHNTTHHLSPQKTKKTQLQQTRTGKGLFSTNQQPSTRSKPCNESLMESTQQRRQRSQVKSQTIQQNSSYIVRQFQEQLDLSYEQEGIQENQQINSYYQNSFALIQDCKRVIDAIDSREQLTMTPINIQL